MTRVYYDFETTGLDYKKHAIWQVAMAVEVDGKVVEVFNRKIKPWRGSEVEIRALEVGHITPEDLETFEDQGVVFHDMVKLITKYQKGYLVGYNNLKFDDFFMREWLNMNGCMFKDLFMPFTIDVLALTTYAFMGNEPKSYKQSEIAKSFNIEVEDEKLHNALYDIVLTRKIFNCLNYELRGSKNIG